MPLSSAVLIKRYAGRRLYHTGMGAYLTLDDLAQMVEDDRDFAVREAETGGDITPSILRQIIPERALHG
jgi:polyhydroxyalkanoate synthesis repressor PhaR